MWKTIIACMVALSGVAGGGEAGRTYAISAHPIPDTGWELVKNEGGIAVYERQIRGKDYLEYKGVTRLRASLASVVSLLNDVRSYPTWLYTCQSASVLSNGEAGERYLYFIYDVPIYSDRDAVMRSCAVRSSDGNSVTMKFARVDMSDIAGLFKAAGRTRASGLAYVKDLSVSWQLVRAGDEVDVVYSIYLDPDIGFPGSLKVNGTTEGLVFQSLKKIGGRLREPVYRNATAAIVEALPARGGCF